MSWGCCLLSLRRNNYECWWLATLAWMKMAISLEKTDWNRKGNEGGCIPGRSSGALIRDCFGTKFKKLPFLKCLEAVVCSHCDGIIMNVDEFLLQFWWRWPSHWKKLMEIKKEMRWCVFQEGAVVLRLETNSAWNSKSSNSLYVLRLLFALIATE